MHSWISGQTTNPFPGRNYLNYANFHGGVSFDVSISAGPFGINKDMQGSIGVGPFSLGKNTGELGLIGWDKSFEYAADIVKPAGPMLSVINATIVYTYVYDQYRVFLDGTTNLKVYQSAIFTPGGKPIGPPQLNIDTTFKSGYATPPVGFGGFSIQKK